MKDITNPDIPFNPEHTIIKHPANDRQFLSLLANDVHPDHGPPNEPRTFGVHHFTALSACLVLAGAPGFLSSSADRDNTEDRAPQDPDAILTLGTYYYHLAAPPATPLYPICLDFDAWRFPHTQMPAAWKRAAYPAEWEEPRNIDNDNRDIIDAGIQLRDRQCRLSGWRDGLSVARIIPMEGYPWMKQNRMVAYALSVPSDYTNDPRNLFALRVDLLTCLFDEAAWVVVPKGGQMVVHFLKHTYEVAALYHNQSFDTRQLSHEFLFVRFAWVVINRASFQMDAASRTHFRLIVPAINEAGYDIQEEGVEGTTSRKEKEREISDADSDATSTDETQKLTETTNANEEG